MDSNIALTLIEALLILLALSISMANRFISPSFYDNQSTVAVDDSSKYDVILAQRDSPLATKYDIFLSFRGEDTRDTFSTYLYEALCDAKIQTFMDHKLHKGDHISPVLLKTIEESDISLIIFSKDYASSSWCMDELVHIMKCKDQYGRTIIPIFYNVDPSNVRKQDGSFGDGFIKLKQRFKHDQRRVQHWTNALIRSTNLSGWHSKNFRPEPELTKMIVKDILSKLSNNSSFHLEGLVGIGHQIQKIEKLLSEARIVGIWGMGGIGKTTLAGVLCDRLKAQFEAFAFVGNVRERLGKIGFDELLEKCLKELLKDDDMKAYNLRSNFVARRLRHKKILLVLDDVHDSIAIEDLIKACGWFGEGSRLIITSRDMQVLKNTYASTYHVQKLEFSHARHLFSLKAFKQNEPSKSYLGLLEQAVHYCDGNPLALKVLGCFLHGKGKKEWESALEKLNQALHQGIFNVLKLSFDGLDDIQKSLFLDLAFFLKEEVWRISMDCIERLYGSAHIDISVLKDRSLILVNKNGNIQMHALLIDMGLEISRQQLISDPGKPIRLRRPEDIYHLFNNDKGIEATRCLSLDESKMKRITLKASHFRKMRNLILFKAYKSNRRKPSALNVCGDLDYLSEELRFFIWEGYPLCYVPLHLCAENLVILEMPNSNIRQLVNENQYFPNLKKIVLEDSKHLTALPDLSHTPKIEWVDLMGCVNLVQIHSSTLPINSVNFWVKNDGPKQINIGGSMKRTRSGLVMVHNYLHFGELSFHKLTIKVLACGDIICGVRFKHVMMPLEEIAELREGTQSLASLLPFVRIVDCLKNPIEFGHDFNQQYTYDIDFSYVIDRDIFGEFEFSLDLRGDRGERDVVGQLGRQMINDSPHFFQDGREREEEERYSKSASLIEDEEEEDDEVIIMEYCGSNSNILFTRLPNSITRWSLLRKLKLKESDIIGNAGCSIPQVSVLKSLIAHSHDHYSTRIQPLLDFKLSFPDMSPSRVYGRPTRITYCLWWVPYQFTRRSLFPDYEINGSMDEVPVQYTRRCLLLNYEIDGSMDENRCGHQIALYWGE